MPIDDITAIETAFRDQWANFGRGPGGAIRQEGGLMWVEAPVPQLPYNAVLETRLDEDVDEAIDRCIAGFRSRDVEFMWVVHPTAQPDDLVERLLTRRLTVVEEAAGMSLDLDRWDPPPAPVGHGAIVYREASDEQGLDEYEMLIAAYWDLSEENQKYVFGINRWGYEAGLGQRWVAYKNDTPVGKVYLSWLGVPDTAAIFGVFVDAQARGHGAATQLTALAIERAREEGKKRVVLHSSKVARRLYERMGFVARCDYPAYGTQELHSLQPA